MLRWAVMLGLLVAMPATAMAQDRCIETLVRANKAFNAQDVSDLALIKLIGDATTVRPQAMSDGTIRYGTTTIGDNFSAARIFASRYFAVTKIAYDQERLFSVASQSFPLPIVRELDDCLTDGGTAGPRILVHDASPRTATITITWPAPSRSRKKLPAAVTVEGGELVSPFPVIRRPGETVSRRVRRQPNADMIITATAGGQTTTARAAWVPRIRLTDIGLVEE